MEDVLPVLRSVIGVWACINLIGGWLAILVLCFPKKGGRRLRISGHSGAILGAVLTVLYYLAISCLGKWRIVTAEQAGQSSLIHIARDVLVTAVLFYISFAMSNARHPETSELASKTPPASPGLAAQIEDFTLPTSKP